MEEVKYKKYSSYDYKSIKEEHSRIRTHGLNNNNHEIKI